MWILNPRFFAAQNISSALRNRVQAKRWIVVNPTVLAMQTASQLGEFVIK